MVDINLQQGIDEIEAANAITTEVAISDAERESPFLKKFGKFVGQQVDRVSRVATPIVRASGNVVRQTPQVARATKAYFNPAYARKLKQRNTPKKQGFGSMTYEQREEQLKRLKQQAAYDKLTGRTSRMPKRTRGLAGQSKPIGRPPSLLMNHQNATIGRKNKKGKYGMLNF